MELMCHGLGTVSLYTSGRRRRIEPPIKILPNTPINPTPFMQVRGGKPFAISFVHGDFEKIATWARISSYREIQEPS